MNLPYGISSFWQIRTQNYFYADKTPFIPRLEDATRGRRYLLFLRPRRFGKSLLLSMLEHYYDLGRAADFDALFAGLFIGSHPTSERSRYLILRLEFTGMPADRGVDALRQALLDRLLSTIRRFFERYGKIVPELAGAYDALPLDTQEPAVLLKGFLDLCQRSPYQLYVLLDEYDNFTATGLVRELYKTLKEGTSTGTIGRLFMTGVSPVTLNDMSSGFNIVKHVSTESELHEICGFTTADVAGIADGMMAGAPYSLSREQVLSDMRRYYNGYLFSPESSERIYNPDMVLHFLIELRPPDRYARQLLDINVRTGYASIRYSRLHRLLFDEKNASRPLPVTQIRSLLADGYLDAGLHDLSRMAEAYDEKYFVSYLYYLGLLTIQRQERNQLRFCIPNYATEGIYGETLNYILETASSVQVVQDDVQRAVGTMAFDGDISAFLRLLREQVLAKLSNRDLIRLDEKSMKLLMLAYLSLTDVFYPFSEFGGFRACSPSAIADELHRGYSDLILTLNRRYSDASYSFLIELKYVKEAAKAHPRPGAAGKGRRRKDAGAPRAVPTAVRTCLLQAEEQLRRYLSDPRLCAIAGRGGWKAVSVVFAGTSQIYFRELGKETQYV